MSGWGAPAAVEVTSRRLAKKTVPLPSERRAMCIKTDILPVVARLSGRVSRRYRMGGSPASRLPVRLAPGPSSGGRGRGFSIAHQARAGDAGHLSKKTILIGDIPLGGLTE